MRVAALDVGSNTVLLTIVEREVDGALHILFESATVTRLAYRVDETKRLDSDAIARTLSCFEQCRQQLDAFQVVELRAVGTSALRDAIGGVAFLERAQEILGASLEVIGGAREAELTFRGSIHGLTVEGPLFVFDIGGGSTELILGDADSKKIHFATSLDLGSVRLSERFQLSDPVTEFEISNLRTLVQDSLEQLPLLVPKSATIVGVAGTVTSLCALSQGLPGNHPGELHGKTLASAEVSRLVEQLARLTVHERLLLPGMSPGRADVILAGAILCEELLLRSSAREFTVSDRGVRFGLLSETHPVTR